MQIMKPGINHIRKEPGTTSRRNFISTCAACGACLAASPLSAFVSTPTLQGRKNMTIRIIFVLHAPVQPVPDWPNIGFDFTGEMEHFTSTLRKHFPKFVFIANSAAGQEDAVKILSREAEDKIDGYIVYQLNTQNRVIQYIATSAKPVLFVDYKYAGTGRFLTTLSGLLKEKKSNIGFVSSSRMEDVIAAVGCFEITGRGGSVDEFVAATAQARVRSTPGAGNPSCKPDQVQILPADETLKRMKESLILAARDQVSGCADPVMGIPLRYISMAELNYAWEKADRHEATAIAEKWQKKAEIVSGVRFNILEDSAAMYLGMKTVLKNHKANAITINCLGGFYGGMIHAYPCLGFHELLNEGLVGACECDIRSSAIMVAVSLMTHGRPGMISDPVIDTSKRQIIYAHCVASNRVFGPGGNENPIQILTHSEDRQGASVRSVMPVDYLTTTLEIIPETKEILLHQGKAVDNDPDDRACRTKLCVEPQGDMEKLFRYWNYGWHRVTFYGDLKKPVYELADASGWKVVEEA
jgi:hypothetical protein